jgi:two-component system LytT family response regulator
LSQLSTLRCAIIDDNEINRLTLEHMVELTEGLELAASLPDAREALAWLRGAPAVDLLLLDVEMPHLSGLDLVRLLPAPAPAVVLVTSHASYAVDAFELQVADYLVKPVDYPRFLKALERVRSQQPAPAAAPAEAEMLAGDGQNMFVRVNNKLVRVNFDEVLYIEALSTYSVIVTEKQKHIVYVTLKSMEDRLPFAHFARVHRSYIVNTHRIESVEDNQLRLGPYEVPIGKSYQTDFMRRLRSL